MSNLLPGFSLPTTESEIDLRLNELRTQFLALCKHRNVSFSTTSKLPPEILAYIFECVRGDSEYYRWVPEVSHICAAWRRIALATPTLWSSGFLNPPEWGIEVLRRAQGASLDVIFPAISYHDKCWEDHPDRLLMRAVLSRSSQIRSVIMPVESVNPGDVFRLFSSLVASSSFPQLTRCQIQIVDPIHLCVLPNDFFAFIPLPPLLHELKLSDCHTPIGIPQFHNLRTLRIQSDPIHSSGYSLSSFHRALRDMHHLEVLYLSDAFVPEEDVSLPDHFVLPKLREVSIKHVSPEPLSLLRGIEAPKITSVDIQIPSTPSQWGTITSLADVQSIFSFASFTPPSLQKPSNHHLEISRSIFEPFLSIFYTQCDGDGNPSKALRILKCDMSLDIVWTIIHRERLRSFSLVLTPEAIPLQMENFNTISSLADSRNLAILQVPYLCFADIGLLATWTSSSAFPQLSSLTLDCLHRKPKNITFLKLKDWLIAREEQGLTALESLQISRCPHHRAVIAGMLKVLVEQLEISCRPLRPPNSIVPSVSYNADENVYS